MQLKLYLLNAQDLFIFLDYYKDEDVYKITEQKWQLLSASFKANKELNKLFKIAQSIKLQDPDIIALVEVGGKESLENFNKHFLSSAYEVHHFPSNSDRGIDMGYLSKPQAQYEFKLYSHNKTPLINSKKFSRGLLELRIKYKKQVKLILMLTHLKSKLDMKKEDFEGRSQRSAEVNEIIRIFKLTQKKFEQIPIAILGDLNGVIYKSETEQELEVFSKNGIIDVLELKGSPVEERYTYYYFNRQRVLNPMQLDYVLIAKDHKSSLRVSECKILKFDEEMFQYPPKSLQDRYKYPSDHLPYQVVFKINT